MNRNYMFVRAIRGPILLIALGVLMLLQRFSDFSFHRSWPILIIVIGLLKLVERAVLRAGDSQAAGTTPGGFWT